MNLLPMILLYNLELPTEGSRRSDVRSEPLSRHFGCYMRLDLPYSGPFRIALNIQMLDDPPLCVLCGEDQISVNPLTHLVWRSNLLPSHDWLKLNYL